VIEQLEQLCLAVGGVSEPDARKVVEAVNRRLSVLLNAEIVKFYWKEEAQEGVILKPVAYINDTQAPDPQRFQLSTSSRGVLEWTFTTGQALWIEDIRSHAREDSMVNLAGATSLPTETLNFADPPQSDAIVVVPIRERGVVCGVYSVELQTSRRLSERVVYLMQRLGRSLGTLLHNADMYDYDIRKSGRAITQFLDSLQGFAFDSVLLDQNWRTAFVARPYAGEFSAVQNVIENALLAFGVRAKHYVPETRQYVVSEIISQIKNAHFCVADLTGNNSNVLAEVGMMMVLGKRLLVLKQRGDEADIPFDLSQFSIFEYELGRGEELLVWSPAEHRMIAFGEILDGFLKQLPAETGFHVAHPWDPDREAQDRTRPERERALSE
jgi:hypothetical protein